MKISSFKIRKTQNFDVQRKVVAHMTSSSWKQIPHVSYLYEPDITDFYGEYRALAEKSGASGYKVTFNTVMIKVVVEGLKQAPALNSLLEYHHKSVKGILHLCDEINVSFPWLLPDGRMITPVMPNSEKKSLAEMAGYISDLGKRIEKTNIDEMLYQAVFSDTVDELKKANPGVLRRIAAAKFGRQRISGLKRGQREAYYSIPGSERLTEKDIMAGTVTVSNIGSLYKEQRGFFGLLQIIPPQIFAIGLGSVQEKPGVYTDEAGEKKIGIRKILPMCLAFDHRAVDFNALVPFLKRTDEIFADPGILRTW